MENHEKEKIRPVSREQAAAALQRVAALDPFGTETPEALAEAGNCFQFSTSDGGQSIVVLRVKGQHLYVQAAEGNGTSATREGLQMIEAIARASGLGAVAFQTRRPGLIRHAKAAGYRVAAVIMEKGI